MATAYAEANVAALHDIQATIERHRIACDLVDAAAVLYATTPPGADRLAQERAVAQAAGLAVRFVDGAGELPFDVVGRVTLPGQAHLPPPATAGVWPRPWGLVRSTSTPRSSTWRRPAPDAGP